MPKIDVQVTYDAWKQEDEETSGEPPSDPLSISRRIVGATNTHLDGVLEDRELAIRFASDKDVAALNHQFRNIDAATNVLSFPAHPIPEQEEDFLGDIILAQETVVAEAAAQNKTLADHTSHLVLHGVLHLLGYDHDEDGRAQEMESLERQILSTLNINDPYTDHLENISGVETSHVS